MRNRAKHGPGIHARVGKLKNGVLYSSYSRDVSETETIFYHYAPNIEVTSAAVTAHGILRQSEAPCTRGLYLSAVFVTKKEKKKKADLSIS